MTQIWSQSSGCREELPKIEFAHHLSSEHLQHLLEDPYYKSAAAPPAPLTEDAVKVWEATDAGSPFTSQQNLSRWRHSVNLTDAAKAQPNLVCKHSHSLPFHSTSSNPEATIWA